MRMSVFIAVGVVVIGQGHAFGGELASVQVKAGSQGRVGATWSCTGGGQVGNISIESAPQNGSFTIVDQPSGAPCGNGAMRVIMYKPNVGFRGEERIVYRVNYIPRGSDVFSRTINVR